MILVAFSHGLRASEVVGIKASDIADGTLTVGRLKGSLRTTQPLIEGNSDLFSERQHLVAYSRQFNANQRIFEITRQHFWRLFQRYSGEAGIPVRKRHPHVLKHSIAMQTIHSAGIENVRQYLGHKSISSTGAYLKISDDDAARAVQGSLKV